MYIYNTLERKKVELKTIDKNEVKMYSCGPTVYSYAHIGNLRTYVFMDILRRTLKSNGYNIKGVMNITDVGHLTSDEDSGEDKMAKASREQKKTPWEIAEYYTKVFFEDLDKLNIERPELTPKATDNIKEMIDFVQELVDKGYGYETSDGIYFDIMKFSGYGKLSGANLEEQIAGARVEVNNEKRHPADFALWKKAPKEHIMQWESPWGMGYPGWHIECSAMGKKYLGDTFDIHTGGVDHIPVHHENEIAQSEALLGHPAVNYWMHGEFMMVNNGKMSKSLKNTYTVSDIKEKGYDPMAFRYLCLNAHYRNKLNFTWEAIDSAQISYIRLLENIKAHKNSSHDEQTQKEAGVLLEKFFEAVNDDLNVPKALGFMWTLAKNPVKSIDIYNALVKMDSILGLQFDKCEEKLEMFNKEQNADIPENIKQMAEKRYQAKKDKNWAVCDEIRNEIADLGYIIKDSKDGYTIEKKK